MEESRPARDCVKSWSGRWESNPRPEFGKTRDINAKRWNVPYLRLVPAIGFTLREPGDGGFHELAFHFFASCSTLGYEYASTNVCSGGCEPSVIARASISTALSIVKEVTTVAHSAP